MDLSDVNPTREEWRPQTRRDRDLVLTELRAILANSHFCNSKRYPALLKYIVENTLAGNSERLKEKTLLVEVFGRRANDDTKTDTVVRYTAGEVRKRLLLYYSSHPTNAGVRISLPAGSYIPEFLRGQEETEPGEEDAEAAAVAGTDAILYGKDSATASTKGTSHLTNGGEARPIRPPRGMLSKIWIWGAGIAALGLVALSAVTLVAIWHWRQERG